MQKRLPAYFVIVSRYYLDRTRYSIKLAGRSKDRLHRLRWYVVETIAIYKYKGVAENVGMAYAHANNYGYIFGVKRGELYKPAHRKAMILPQ